MNNSTLQERILRIKNIPAEDEIDTVRKELALNTEEGNKLWKEYEQTHQHYKEVIDEVAQANRRLEQLEQLKHELRLKQQELYNGFRKLGRTLLEKELEN